MRALGGHLHQIYTTLLQNCALIPLRKFRPIHASPHNQHSKPCPVQTIPYLYHLYVPYQYSDFHRQRSIFINQLLTNSLNQFMLLFRSIVNFTMCQVC